MFRLTDLTCLPQRSLTHWQAPQGYLEPVIHELICAAPFEMMRVFPKFTEMEVQEVHQGRSRPEVCLCNPDSWLSRLVQL